MARCGTALLFLASVIGASSAEPVVVTGATGRTGALVYNMLKNQGFDVRAVVRNRTKARDLLGCSRCDQREGIFVGDVTDAASLEAPMQGGGSLVIASSSVPICDSAGCHFPPGGSPLDVDWNGARNQIEAFAKGTPAIHQAQVILISTMGTTSPESRLDKMDHIVWYKLNFEAFLMGSGIPFVIIKPCGLVNQKAGQKEIIVGHEDKLEVNPPIISRADVARITVAALQHPTESRGLRFDVCSKAGTPTSKADLDRVLKKARYPWDHESTLAGPASEEGHDLRSIHALRV